ncbi:MAG: hypothetical protein WAP03_22050 [Methylorubrum rhodinum]|uniref:hypothetical protein n=1 Tax=Methylorubrum rhodinum TaxID=29428 RepID=UPI003BB11EE8
MTPTQRRLGVAALRATLAALLASGGDRIGQPGADLRRLCGALDAEASVRVQSSTFSGPLRACFQAATAAGASLDGMDRVRSAALAITNPEGAVQRVVQTAVRYALVEMCLITAATTYASRQDVEAGLARLNAAFGPAEDYAAGQFNNRVYRALIGLHAAATRDLTQRARPLPRLTTYAFPNRMPALALANRLYGDGGRAGELIAENRGVIHPLFMPAAGRALFE